MMLHIQGDVTHRRVFCGVFYSTVKAFQHFTHTSAQSANTLSKHTAKWYTNTFPYNKLNICSLTQAHPEIHTTHTLTRIILLLLFYRLLPRELQKKQQTDFHTHERILKWNCYSISFDGQLFICYNAVDVDAGTG